MTRRRIKKKRLNTSRTHSFCRSMMLRFALKGPTKSEESETRESLLSEEEVEMRTNTTESEVKERERECKNPMSEEEEEDGGKKLEEEENDETDETERKKPTHIRNAKKPIHSGLELRSESSFPSPRASAIAASSVACIGATG